MLRVIEGESEKSLALMSSAAFRKSGSKKQNLSNIPRASGILSHGVDM